VRATNMLADVYDKRVLQQLDDLQMQLAEQQNEMQRMLTNLQEVVARVPGSGLERWYQSDAFNAHFRGDAADILERYRDLAAHFGGHGPVLDIGFGRGEFLQLLADLGVEARGIEVDAEAIEWGRLHGLDVEVGRAVEYLETLEDSS